MYTHTPNPGEVPRPARGLRAPAHDPQRGPAAGQVQGARIVYHIHCAIYIYIYI